MGHRHQQQGGKQDGRRPGQCSSSGPGGRVLRAGWKEDLPPGVGGGPFRLKETPGPGVAPQRVQRRELVPDLGRSERRRPRVALSHLDRTVGGGGSALTATEAN